MFKYKKSIYSRQLIVAYQAMVKNEITMAHFSKCIHLITENMELLFRSLKNIEDFEEIICSVTDKNKSHADIIREAKDFPFQVEPVEKESKGALIVKFSSLDLSSPREASSHESARRVSESIHALKSIFSKDPAYFRSKIEIDPVKEDQILPQLMNGISHVLDVHVSNVSSTITHELLLEAHFSPE